MDVEPHRVAKLSGIGCSSKTPDYFLGNSHGFNTVHGRMPSVLTGANLANRELLYLGVSGDGDSASIGIGQFVHVMRRGVNMVYIVENNGVYGLTKGQFSATADQGSTSKKGVVNADTPIDMVSLALQLGATFVARSFSGDKRQLVPLIKAAIAHRGAAFLDVISPCVAFNNHPGSTKSYDYVREHNEAVNRIDVIPTRARRSRWTSPRANCSRSSSTMARCCACANCTPDYDPRQPHRRDELHPGTPGARRSRDRPAVRGPAMPPTCTSTSRPPKCPSTGSEPPNCAPAARSWPRSTQPCDERMKRHPTRARAELNGGAIAVQKWPRSSSVAPNGNENRSVVYDMSRSGARISLPRDLDFGLGAGVRLYFPRVHGSTIMLGAKIVRVEHGQPRASSSAPARKQPSTSCWSRYPPTEPGGPGYFRPPPACEANLPPARKGDYRWP